MVGGGGESGGGRNMLEGQGCPLVCDKDTLASTQYKTSNCSSVWYCVVAHAQRGSSLTNSSIYDRIYYKTFYNFIYSILKPNQLQC